VTFSHVGCRANVRNGVCTTTLHKYAPVCKDPFINDTILTSQLTKPQDRKYLESSS